MNSQSKINVEEFKIDVLAIVRVICVCVFSVSSFRYV